LSKHVSRKLRHPIKYPITFLVPALFVYVVFFVYPTISGFYYSLTDWNSRSSVISFIGLDQFRQVFKNQIITLAFKNTLIYSFVITILKNFLALPIAVAMNAKIYTRNTLRAIYFSPAILNIVAMGLVFQGLLNPNTGFVNNVLSAIGLGGLNIRWIGDPKLAIYCTALMEIWRATGISMVIYLAGLQVIPQDYYAAATIDGAGEWQKFTTITFPLLAPAITINIILCLIYGFRMFEVIYYLTGGGPGNASQVMQTLAYKYMGQGLYGYSAAVSVILVVFILVVTIPLLSYMRRRDSKVV
jgi:raffinose/stachyose/melibiose transport system permease protein